MSNLGFVDCEAYGPCPALGRLTWFGAVRYNPEAAFDALPTFDGLVEPDRARDQDGPRTTASEYHNRVLEVFAAFDAWLALYGRAHTLVSDNPAFDWQWINDGFWRALGRNPFGHSARRVGDFYAGLVGDFRQTQDWKRLRVTKHDHNPVHDALGNAEAFRRLVAGERPPVSRRYR